MLCLVVFSQAAAAGDVYRCAGPNGVPLYTDRGCPGGERIEEEALQPDNVFEGAPIAEAPEVPARRRRSGGGTGCNNTADLRHIDLMLKSLATDARQKRFLRAERRRVQSCQLENLSHEERQRRDAALRRTHSLRGSEREAAETEIEDLYGARRSRRKGGK
jgi:hypothetical protein